MVSDNSSSFAEAIRQRVDVRKDYRTLLLADHRRLRGNARQFFQAFERTAEIAYSVKALADSQLLSLWKEEGIHRFEVGSVEEASETITSAPGTDVIFGNPFKTPFQIERALTVGVSHFVVDSRSQIDELVSALRSFPQPEPVTLTLRVRPVSINPEAICCFATKFGISPREVSTMVSLVRDRIPTAKIGLSIHVGTGTRDPSVFETEIANLWKLAKSNGITEFINIGGGFPIVYPGIDKEFEIVSFLSRVSAAIAAQQRQYSVDTVITEPGRALIGDAITSVHPILETRPPNGIVINDGIYNTFVSASIHSIFPHAQLYRQKNGTWSALDTPSENQTVWGVTCDGKDQFETCFPSGAQKGDCLVVHSFGAYTAASAGSRFNGLGYVPDLFFFNQYPHGRNINSESSPRIG